MQPYQHKFLFTPGTWVGEGKVTFSASPEHLHFYTKWTNKSNPDADGPLIWVQQVEVQSAGEAVYNQITIDCVTHEKFNIELKNTLVEQIRGKGLIDDKTIAWEYRGIEDFEGFEVYTLQENGDYMIHAEYASQDEYRTIIDGRIWLKSSI